MTRALRSSFLAAIGAATAAAIGCKARSPSLDATTAPGSIAVWSMANAVHIEWSRVPGASGYSLAIGANSPSNPSSAALTEVDASTTAVDFGTASNDVIFVQIAARFGTRRSAFTPLVSAREMYLDLPLGPEWVTSGGIALGSAVALADVNGDGLQDVVVGDPDAGGGAGRVRAYLGKVDGIDPTPWFDQTGAPGSRLGAAIADVGDTQSSGCDTVIVGAPGANAAWSFESSPLGPVGSSPVPVPAGSVAFGSAFARMVRNGDLSVAVGDPLYGGSGRVAIVDLVTVATAGVLAPTQSLGAGAMFGAAIASADVDGDGNSELLVGAPGRNSDAGYAALFVGTNGTPAWEAGTQQQGSQLGAAVAFVDLDNNARPDAVIGAPRRQVDGNPSGEVFVYAGAATAPFFPSNPTQTIQSPSQNAGFGGALGGADFSGDGIPDLLVGATNGALGNANGGVVFVFEGGGGNLVSSQWADGIGRSAGIERYGKSFATGDVNGDGLPDLFVGVPGINVAELRFGSPQSGLALSAAGPFAATTGTPQVVSAVLVDVGMRHACTWNFGDGETLSTACAPGVVSATHTWAAGGSYPVTLSVRALDERDASFATTIEVQP